MNRNATTQAASFALAAFFTLVMLVGVNGLATSEPSPELVAKVMQTAPRA